MFIKAKAQVNSCNILKSGISRTVKNSITFVPGVFLKKSPYEGSSVPHLHRHTCFSAHFKQKHLSSTFHLSCWLTFATSNPPRLFSTEVFCILKFLFLWTLWFFFIIPISLKALWLCLLIYFYGTTQVTVLAIISHSNFTGDKINRGREVLLF